MPGESGANQIPPDPSSYEDRLISCYPNTIRKCFDLKIPMRKIQSKNASSDDDEGDMDIDTDAEKRQNRKHHLEKILEEVTDSALLQSLQTEILPPSKAVQPLPWQQQQQHIHLNVNNTSDDDSDTGVDESSSSPVKPAKSKSRKPSSNKKIHDQLENESEEAETKSVALKLKAQHGRGTKPIKALVLQLVAQQVLPNFHWSVKQSGTLQDFNYDICDSILTALYAHHAQKYVTNKQTNNCIHR